MKDCNNVRARMRITYSPVCSRCGSGPCTLKPSSFKRHAEAIRRKYGLDAQGRRIKHRYVQP
jgi:hypothetical protein